jgi:hypothetical protein
MGDYAADLGVYAILRRAENMPCSETSTYRMRVHSGYHGKSVLETREQRRGAGVDRRS